MSEALPMSEDQGTNMASTDEFWLVWEETMGHPLTPIRHDNTAVLMLSWDQNDTDDENVGTEVAKLADVFRRLYGFKVYSHTLSTQKRPQVTATRYVAEFFEAEEKPRSLLIVYYAGHGSEADEGGKISLCGKSPCGKINKKTTIDWTAVETTAMEDTPADVLVILDCCHAGLLCRPAHRGPLRCFQYLVACPETGRTKMAGPQSFSTALTLALESLAVKPGFHSSELLATITKVPDFPKDQYPNVYGGRYEPSEEFIYIAPMRPNESEAVSPIGKFRDEQVDDLRPKQILDLRFYFEPPLNSETVRTTAMQLKHLMKRNQIPCSRIRLLERDSIYAQWAVRRWMQTVSMSKISKLHAGISKAKNAKPKARREARVLRASSSKPSSPSSGVEHSTFDDTTPSLFQEEPEDEDQSSTIQDSLPMKTKVATSPSQRTSNRRRKSKRSQGKKK